MFMKKSISLLVSGLLVSTLAMSSSVMAQDELENSGKKVITEGVTFVEGDLTKGAQVASDDGAAIVGKVGEFTAVRGEMPKGYIAFVQNPNNENYFIGDKIVVHCLKNRQCVPAGISAEKIGITDLYEVKVSNYNEWVSTKKALENAQGVKKVLPDYFYGITPKVQ